MNRIIKFRAWDGTKMHQLDFEYIAIDAENDVKLIFGYAFHDDYVEQHKKMELIEFSGLTDPNGVEIYEGHILDDRRVAGEHKYITSKCIVIFQNGCFLAQPINKEAKGTQTISAYDKVIGNIYENPKLLKS